MCAVLNLAIPNGNYTVNFRLAEIYWQRDGQRKFAISAEGQTRLASVDIAAEKGKRTYVAYDLSAPNIVDNDGEPNIGFNAIVDAAKVSAFVVRGSHTAAPDWNLVWQDEFDVDDSFHTYSIEWSPERISVKVGIVCLLGLLGAHYKSHITLALSAKHHIDVGCQY